MNFDDLEYVRINDPEVLAQVPREYLEMSDCGYWDVPRFYEFIGRLTKFKGNVFWMLVTSTGEVKGLLWVTVDSIAIQVMVQLLSVAKEYRNPPGRAIEKTIEFLIDFKNETSKKTDTVFFKPLIWPTCEPEKFEAMGHKRSKHVLMEVR